VASGSARNLQEYASFRCAAAIPRLGPRWQLGFVRGPKLASSATTRRRETLALARRGPLSSRVRETTRDRHARDGATSGASRLCRRSAICQQEAADEDAQARRTGLGERGARAGVEAESSIRSKPGGPGARARGEPLGPASLARDPSATQCRGSRGPRELTPRLRQD